MSLLIEKIDGGYIVTHHTTRQIATADHVARLIMKFLPDVMAHLRELIDQEAETVPELPNVTP